jgi:hypothetical protein
MLVKKIYGCLTIADYRKGVTAPKKKRSRTRYSQLSAIKPRSSLRKTG